MDNVKLQQHIRMLACLNETPEYIISCYVNLTESPIRWREKLQLRFTEIHNGISSANGNGEMETAISRIWEYLGSPEIKDARGIAVFIRQGEQPVWLPLKFSVPVPTWVSIDTLPNIYHLVELQDRYQRYIVLLSTRNSARIFEITLGEVSKRLFFQRPMLRKRVGREWTRMHYQNHIRERGLQFLREKIEMLQKLIWADGQIHLVLAGDTRISQEIKAALPQRVANFLIDIVPLSNNAKIDEVIASTLQAFIAAEERESKTVVERLLNAFYKDDLAAVGVAESIQCLLRRQADMLIIRQEGDLGRLRSCPNCCWAVAGYPLPDTCMECGHPLGPVRDARSELVRMAELNGRPIETVKDLGQLDAFGGAACLLRYSNGIRRATVGYKITKETGT